MARRVWLVRSDGIQTVQERVNAFFAALEAARGTVLDTQLAAAGWADRSAAFVMVVYEADREITVEDQ
jgi:hypothetical protein